MTLATYLSIFLALLAIAASNSLNSVPSIEVIPDGNATRITACEGQEAELVCQIGTVIRVEIANFGRFSRTICLTEAELNDGVIYPNCLNDKSIEILRKKCNGQRDCRQLALLEAFGDVHPCPLTKNIYLELKYTCVPEETTTTTTTTPQPTTTTTSRADVKGVSGKSVQTTAPARHLFCPAVDVHGVKFLRTVAGHVFTTNCMEGATGQSSWQCTSEGEWLESGPNTTGCISDWTYTRRQMLDEMRERRDGPGMLEILRNLAQDTHRTMQAGDLPLLANLLDDIVETLITEYWTKSVKTVCNEKLVELINYVARSQDAWPSWPIETRRKLGNKFLGYLEKVMAWSVGDHRSDQTNLVYPQPSIIVQMSDMFLNLPGLDYISLPSVPIWDNQDSVDVPVEALRLTGSGESRVMFSTMSSMSANLEPTPDFRVTKENPMGEKVQRRVVSNIVTASVLAKGGIKRISVLDKPVFINLVHSPEAMKGLSNPQCSWWNEDKLAWYQTGCELRSHNSSHTVCACSHMTHFALLMDVRGIEISPFNNQMLTLLTYIGCSFSILCLVITFICFVVFARGGGDRIFIHKNLCFVLAIAELVFLLGIWRTDNNVECSVIAGALLYLFLASLTWMLLEGYQLYQMLVEVFPTGSRKILFTVIGYGFPGVVTSVAAYIDPSGFGTADHCWLRTDNMFILAFVGPAALILTLNTFFLFMTMCIVCRHHNGGYLPCRTEPDLGRNVRVWVKSALAISCLLGVTWTLGFLWIDGVYTIYMAYAFTVFNSLQGLAIFLFHVVLSDKMRKDIGRWMARHGCCRPSEPQKGSLPRGALSPSGGSGSGTGSEFLYPSSEKYTTSPRTIDTMGGPYGRGLLPDYQPQMVQAHQGTYDYATISYGEMLPGPHVYRTPPSFAYGSRSPYSMGTMYKDQNYGFMPQQHHRPPPEFSPPPPPQQVSRALYYAARRAPSCGASDDSAYSENGSSVLTTEVTPTGATVLRMDLKNGSHAHSQEV